MYCQFGASSPKLAMPTRGHVAPRLGRVPPIRQINCQTVTRHERKLTWGRRVPEAADKIAVYRVKVFLFEFF